MLTSAPPGRKYPGATIVTDSVTSNGLAAYIRERGGKHLRYRRGYKNVISKGALASAGRSVLQCTPHLGALGVALLSSCACIAPGLTHGPSNAHAPEAGTQRDQAGPACARLSCLPTVQGWS